MKPKKTDYISIHDENGNVALHDIEFVHKQTGEVLEVDHIKKYVSTTKNFWKLYLFDFLNVLGLFNSKMVDVLVYILEHTDKVNNLFIGTYKEIAAGAEVSQPTIARTFKILKEGKFIAKVQNGVWRINANIMLRGNDNKRAMLVEYFNEEYTQNENNPL